MDRGGRAAHYGRATSQAEQREGTTGARTVASQFQAEASRTNESSRAGARMEEEEGWAELAHTRRAATPGVYDSAGFAYSLLVRGVKGRL